MLDLIILFFLCRKIGNTAREKNRKPILWQLFTVISWFVTESIGFNMALGWLGYQEIKTITEAVTILAKNPGILFFSLFCGYGGYLLVRYILEKKEPIQPL